MMVLAAYDRARAAIAQAFSVDQVKAAYDDLEHVKLYSKQIKDRELLVEASIWQKRAERRMGEIIAGFKAGGKIVEGRRRKDDIERVTLKDIGVDLDLSSRSQKAASMEADIFEATMSALADKIRAGKAMVVDGEVINGARAVMGSRQEPDDSLDYFPTPPWATRALVEHVFPVLDIEAADQTAGEPACGEGHIAEVLKEYFADVRASDIHDYGYGGLADFLRCAGNSVDWIITNPPFGDTGEAFVHHALELAHIGIAMFMRVQWLDSIGRYERVFRDKPPTLIAFFAERVNLCKGRWDPEGGTATAYMWLVWKNGVKPRAPFWIPPGCREDLAKPDDVVRFTTHPVTKRIQEAA